MQKYSKFIYDLFIYPLRFHSFLLSIFLFFSLNFEPLLTSFTTSLDWT